MRSMNIFGIDSLDAALGDLEDGRVYLLRGNDEFDLQLFAMAFATAGAEGRSRSGMITDRDGEGLEDVGRTLGLDVRALVNGEKLAVLRYQPFVGEKVVSLKSSGRIIYELKNLFLNPFPERLAICPVQPFLTFSNPDELIESQYYLKEAVGRLQTTVLLTYLERDSRQDPYVLNQLEKISHGTFHLRQEPDGSRSFRVEKAWGGTQSGRKFYYSVRKGRGIMAVPAAGGASDGALAAETANRVLVVTPDEARRQAMTSDLQGLYKVDTVAGDDEATQRLFTGAYGALIYHDLRVEKVLAFLKYLRMQDVSLPVLVLTSPLKRASERATVLLYGADEVLYEPAHISDVLVVLGNVFQRHQIRPTFFQSKEFIRIRERIADLVRSSLEKDPETGLWSVPSFLQLGNLMLTEAHLLNQPKLLAAFRVKGFDGVPPRKIIQLLRKQVREEDPLTLLPSGNFLMLMDSAGGDTVADIGAKITEGLEAALNERMELRRTAVVFPRDGASIEELLDRLGKKLSS
jgi:DNA-binding response OmpR family regulator/KaiC/GvpD/RAD55 family RecA-like ATPase